MTDQTNETVEYRIDANDVITDVGRAWTMFARRNGGESLIPETVLGRSLWRFVRGDETVRLYGAICEHVRHGNQPATFPFRCDSPTMNRYMEMTISPAGNGSLLFSSHLTLEERCRQRSAFVCGSRSAQVLLLRCSMCNRIQVRDRWLDPTLAISTGGLFTQSPPFQVAYSICPDCDSRIELRLLRG